MEKLIILEGIKGSGKSTLASYLRDFLPEKVTYFHFPIDAKIRRWTKHIDQSGGPVSEKQKIEYAYMQAIDKFLAVRTGGEVHEALRKGTVIFDRFIDSFVVCQRDDIIKENFDYIVNKTTEMMDDLPAYIIHLYLDCSIGTALNRIQERKKLDDRFVKEIEKEKERYDEIWTYVQNTSAPYLNEANGVNTASLDDAYRKKGILFIPSFKNSQHELFVKVNTDGEFEEVKGKIENALIKIEGVIKVLN